jgi:hypothetical protein
VIGRRALSLGSGVALVGLSACLYFFAADKSLQNGNRKVITFVVSPSLVHRVEWHHSVPFWLALASLTLALGATALIVSCRFANRFGKPSW